MACIIANYGYALDMPNGISRPFCQEGLLQWHFMLTRHVIKSTMREGGGVRPNTCIEGARDHLRAPLSDAVCKHARRSVVL